MLIAASFAMAEETATRTYQLPDHGFIQLQVPKSWREELRQPPGPLPPTIVFSSKTGASFKVLLTLLFSVRQDMAMPTPSEVKRNVERAAEGAQRQAVEKTISIKELKGPPVIGYYFSATDRSPKPGEYRYMIQGMLRVGDLAPTFTILTNKGAENINVESLSMLMSAIHADRAP